MNENLRLLIHRNKIDEKQFEQNIYDTLLLSVFENICLKMKNDNIRQEVLSLFHTSKNYIKTVEIIIKKYTGCIISEEESKIIFKWLIAYFRKNERRRNYCKAFKIEMLKKQNYKCKICGKNIEYSNSELDHIIPWDFVGDELEDNLQMLCNECNERKGRSIDFEFKMLLIN